MVAAARLRSDNAVVLRRVVLGLELCQVGHVVLVGQLRLALAAAEVEAATAAAAATTAAGEAEAGEEEALEPLGGEHHDVADDVVAKLLRDVEAHRAVLVVDLTLLLITQDRVRVVDLLELKTKKRTS